MKTFENIHDGETYESLSPQEHRTRVLAAPVVLRVRELSKSFNGLKAVDKVSFNLHRGEVISIIGPNGSGKSTTINLISGFLAPDDGLIDINDQAIAGLSAAEVSERGLARTFQNGRVFGSLTVNENIALGYHKKLSDTRPLSSVQDTPIIRWLNLLGETAVSLINGPAQKREHKDVSQRIDREIDYYRERLGSRVNDATYTLSYANRRRTEIARAHISEPEILLLDEPTAGMNQSETAEVLQQLLYLKEQGHTILLVEHKMDLVATVSDRVIAMDGGKIIAVGDPDEVRSNPLVVESYLGRKLGSDDDVNRVRTQVRAERNAGVLNSQNAVDDQEQNSLDFGDDTKSLLTMKDVNVYYGQVHALQDVNLTVPQGAIVSLLGGNASGKSTTMKTLLGINKVTSGSITYNGEDITHTSTRERVKQGIAAVPEARRIFPQMTIYENLLTGAYTQKDRARVAEDVAAMYERFPRLKERRNQLAGTMSGGEQQMLAFARALMSHPRLICMDEPTMGLSPRLVEDVLEQIASLRDDLGVSVLMVEQQAQLALSIADYGYVLQSGRIRLAGTGAQLLDDPRVQEAYLGGAGRS
ncbi:ATP-binding cassette domain-containing protein [Alloscardovia theropitheci]|uniref:ATP-binding cassette domain-containing protein n=1 Tax=Alloscardovia theropitheci TaxID=2496842 RepID=A0A4R0QYA5_9BIFI|nr:ATP-binding cassette domain-containing protein [Alloscardovia theropitheci]TCD54561.1 ATP-binding cassette domain-containing protein [Alloscardovia theropitheci]